MAQVPYNSIVGLTYQHISNAGTTVVKAKPGMLASVIVNQGTGPATLALFDNSVTTTGTVVIGTIELASTTVVGPQQPIVYNVQTNTGLVVVASGYVDATITFR